MDALLLGLGVTLAVLWRVSPWALLVAVPPLTLLNRALESADIGEAAISDVQSGLYNLGYLRQACRQEIERASRGGGQLAVLISDVDWLRVVNTRFGHLTGDKVPLRIAQVIRRSVRGMDVAARFGGEKFVVLLPECSKRTAGPIAERLRAAVAAELSTSAGLGLLRLGMQPDAFGETVSVGVAAFPEDGASDDALLAAANRALHRAKEAGRNRVALASAVGEPFEVAGEGQQRPLVRPATGA
jgi:diguanylate cyclase (GGDEF)-like protein